MESKDIKLLGEAYSTLREDEMSERLSDMMPDTYEKGQTMYGGEDESRELGKLSGQHDELERMSDAELVDAAHDAGVEEEIVFDAEGGLADREKVISAIVNTEPADAGQDLDADAAAVDIMSKGGQAAQVNPGGPGKDEFHGQLGN